uniref:Uncharacterized protein n=1 Tax=Graphocephala atropunctata TaxID=36148 RepID=A0A1B6LHF1_9HEMI
MLLEVLAQFLIAWWSSAEFIYGNLLDYTQNLTAVYKDPGHVFGEDLMRTAVFYLDELMELEEALEDENEKPKAVETLKQLYQRGGPKHVKGIPYPLLIDSYNWTSSEVDDYASYIKKTSECWDRLIKGMRKYVKTGSEKDDSDSESSS